MSEHHDTAQQRRADAAEAQEHFLRLRWLYEADGARSRIMGHHMATNADLKAWRSLGRKGENR